MTNAKSTKRALLLSVVSLFLCFTMLLGTTYAWFTDSASAKNNIIVAGNLDVDLEWSSNMTTWEKLDDTDNLFEGKLWEPGHTEVVYLKVTNLGTLALKYQLGVNVVSEVEGTNVANEKFKLSDYIEYDVVETDAAYADRAAALAAATDLVKISKEFSKDSKLENNADYETVALIVTMPETVGNEANYKTGTTKPEITLGINVFATQLAAEIDSFGPDYDENAPVIEIEVTPANIQAYLNGENGSLDNKKLVLTAGDYSQLVLGLPTKYAGSNTTMYCETHDYTTTDAEAFKAHLADGQWHTTPMYTREINNLAIVAKEGAAVNVAGVVMTSGHAYGAVVDYVRDITYTSGSAYYMTQTVNNLSFEGINFTGKIDINTSEAKTKINGVSFADCSFTTGGTASSNGAAIRYYNESNNGNVKNLTVDGCTFDNCYQGIYTHHIYGVSVTNCEFSNLGHNAIAIQNHAGVTNHGAIVIEHNMFDTVSDRVIRFNEIGADTQITINYNVATNSGDDAHEIIKATSLAAGIKYDVNYNSWGGTVVNPELRDVKTADIAADATGFKGAAANASGTGTILMLDDLMVEDLTFVNFAKETVVNGNGNSMVRDTASGNPLLVNTTNKVTFENIKFESTKGSAVLATRKEGANIVVNNCVFQNHGAPSTGNTGVQVYASNVTMTFNNCTFNNMPVVTNSSYPEDIELVFNNCTFNWEGDNCPGFIQIANNLKIKVDLNNCTMNYTTNSQYTTAKTMISFNWPDAATINIDGLKVNGTRNNDKIWKIASSNSQVTINTTGELVYTFNGNTIDFATYLR